jgi:hypothetical protein
MVTPCLGEWGAPRWLGMLSYAFIDGFTETPRHEAIARLKAAIADVDGVIVDFAFFEGRALRLSIELELGSLPRFRAALENASLVLFEKCAVELAKLEKSLATEEAPPTRPIVVLLHVAFLSEGAQVAVHA